MNFQSNVSAFQILLNSLNWIRLQMFHISQCQFVIPSDNRNFFRHETAPPKLSNGSAILKKGFFLGQISLDPGQNARGNRGRTEASWRHFSRPASSECTSRSASGGHEKPFPCYASEVQNLAKTTSLPETKWLFGAKCVEPILY